MAAAGSVVLWAEASNRKGVTKFAKGKHRPVLNMCRSTRRRDSRVALSSVIRLSYSILLKFNVVEKR
jgi:hypothetical protein